jgi:hypothetical protein
LAVAGFVRLVIAGGVSRLPMVENQETENLW